MKKCSVLLLIVVITLFGCNSNAKLGNFYYRTGTNNVAKCIEINKDTATLYNVKDGVSVKWVFKYEVKDGNLILIEEDGTKVTYKINKDSLFGESIMTEGEYKDITYKKGTKEDFNKIIGK